MAATSEKKCPRCAEMVKREASACRFCGHEFPAESSKTGRPRWITPAAALGVIVLASLAGRQSPEERAAKEAEQQAAAEKDAIERQARAADRAASGKHCMSAWDGSHRGMERFVKHNLRDPDSYEHVETGIKNTGNGEHQVQTVYRARNGYGGMAVEKVTAVARNSDCEVIRLIE